MTATTTETLPAPKISSSSARVGDRVPPVSWRDAPKVGPALVDALNTLEKLRVSSVRAADSFEAYAEAVRASCDHLWVKPITLAVDESRIPWCDPRPRHPRRVDRNRWTAREYRAACRRHRRELRAWSRREPKWFHEFAIHAEGYALTPDGTVQKFGYQQIVPKSLFMDDLAFAEYVRKRVINELRAALVRHWEEA